MEVVEPVVTVVVWSVGAGGWWGGGSGGVVYQGWSVILECGDEGGPCGGIGGVEEGHE